MLTVLEFWSYDGLKLTELIPMEVSSIKQSGDQRLSPDAPFSRTFSQTTYSPYIGKGRPNNLTSDICTCIRAQLLSK